MDFRQLLSVPLLALGMTSPLFGQEINSTNDPLVTSLEIGETLSFHSEALDEVRSVNIYLPAGYHPDSAATYPVIYLLDGGMDEDFLHIMGLLQFGTFPWVDMMPPSILVGIENVDRRRDFTYPSSVGLDRADFPSSGHSKEFIDFIGSELQPLIKTRYRCNGQQMIIGQSLGGLLATEILYTDQGLFDKYLIVSPSLWWDNGSMLDKEIELMADTKVFISVGKEGEIMEAGSRKLNGTLVDAAVNGNQVDFLYFGEQDHGNILHLAVYYGLQSFYPKGE